MLHRYLGLTKYPIQYIFTKANYVISMKIEITSMRQQYRMAISEYICTYILTYIIPSTYFYLLLQTRDRTQLSRQAGDKKTDPLSKKKLSTLRRRYDATFWSNWANPCCCCYSIDVKRDHFTSYQILAKGERSWHHFWFAKKNCSICLTSYHQTICNLHQIGALLKLIFRVKEFRIITQHHINR